MSNNTIFDDVFRTLVEKMPQLTIPFINEIFGTNYPEDIEMEQRRNEHQTKDGEVITDSHLQIREKSYHLECQSTKDSTMVIRMLEYDFAIALDSIDEESGKLRGYFPYSCVLYLRGKTGEATLEMELIIRTADYILKDAENAKKGLGEIMGGKVLELESDKLISQGIKRGIDLEKKNTEKERQRANAAEAEVARLKKLLAEKK